MSYLQMPVRADIAAYVFTTTLEGRLYEFAFDWNSRDESWMMSVRTEAGEEIVSGIPIRLGVSLLGRHKDTRLPPGEFFAWDTTEKYEEAGETDFGDRVLLMYRESTTAEGE